MSKNNAFDSSDTVEMKGAVTGITRFSKKGKGLLALGSFVLMCFILFSIFSMGEDDAASHEASSDQVAKVPSKKHEPARITEELFKDVSDGQAAPGGAAPVDLSAIPSNNFPAGAAAPTTATAVAVPTVGHAMPGPTLGSGTPSPIAANAPGSMGPGFEVGQIAPPVVPAPQGSGKAAPFPLLGGTPPAGKPLVRSGVGGGVPADTPIVPAPDGSGMASGNAAQQRPTPEQLAAQDLVAARVRSLKQARDGGTEVERGGWSGGSGEGAAGAATNAMAMVQDQIQKLSGGGGLGAGAAALPRALLPTGAGGQDDANKQQRKEQFLKDAQGGMGPDYIKQTVVEPVSPFEIKQGWKIPVALENGVNSDLPGQVCARVREDVFDSATGRHLLIPQGTKACGVYDSQIAVGQTRILMAWQRLIFPNGSTMNIDGMPGADQAGYSGMGGDVNNHYFRLFGSALMLSMVSAATQLSQPQQATGSNGTTSAGQVISGAVGQQLGQVSSSVIQRQMQVQPTITQEPGYRFVIEVTKDMVFPSEYRRRARG